jgi:hypothetical protein
MTTIRRGDIVRYKNPYPDEVGDLMVIIEWNIERGFGKHLHTNLTFPPITLLREEDIEVVGTTTGNYA